MNDERALSTSVESGWRLPTDTHSEQQLQAIAPPSAVRRIAVAASFTADSLQHPLQFWMNQLDIELEVVTAAYAQLIQELLDPCGLFRQNASGFNIILLRVEDWIRDRPDDFEGNIAHLRRVVAEFGAAVAGLRSANRSVLLFFFCPPSDSLPQGYARAFSEMQKAIIAQVSVLERVYCWTHADLMQLYPVPQWQDERADRIGHVPFTDEYFAALATLLARRIAVLSKPSCKVIALDCDNTLWQGICGEDGVNGIELTAEHIEFQQLLVRQHDAGVLLCLCSKNNQADVDAVFSAHSHMPLRPHHFVCSRVNWDAKSANIVSLARELDLALDSFVMVDDSPLECAEIFAHCPNVLTLQFPQSAGEIRHFLDHVWAFDRLEATDDARRRTAQYKENRARAKAQEEAGDFRKFLASLDLQVDVAEGRTEHMARVAELIQRTNQFNLTAIRRDRGELQVLCESGGLQVLVIHVRDRFGDYGLVGALLLRRAPDSIEVDTFVLSCRALGRAVEHRILNELGRKARAEGRGHIVLRYRETARNLPARTFLERSFALFRMQPDAHAACGEALFKVPAASAEQLTPAASGSPPEQTRESGAAAPPAASGATLVTWHEAALRLSRLAELMAAIRKSRKRALNVRAAYVAPRTPAEAAVARVWAELLGLGEVGAHDGFFDLGGDSLLAVRAIARVGALLGMELPLHDFFAEPTVQQVAARLSVASGYAAIERADRTIAPPASLAQQRLWFVDQLEGGSPAYHIPLVIHMTGELDCRALRQALDSIVSRHEILRTSFVAVEGEARQQIAAERRFDLQVLELESLPASQRKLETLKHSAQQLESSFDLCKGPLIRGKLLRFSRTEYVLLITMHHIVADGWSLDVLIRELSELYACHREARPAALAQLPLQYADYAQWQRKWLAGGPLQQHLAFWREHLRDAPELLQLPADRPRPAIRGHRGGSVPFVLDSDLAAEIKTFARCHDLTLAMTLHAAWTILLHRLSGQDDLVVGVPVANRLRAELDNLIGLFVNTLAVRVRLDDDLSAADFLLRVKRIMLDAYAHQNVPFEQVVEAVQPARSLSHTPVFQVMFVMQSASSGPLHLPEVTLTTIDVPLQAAKFDLVLSLQEAAGEIRGSLTYASDIFDAGTIGRWTEHFVVLLRAIIREPQTAIFRLPLLSAADRYSVLEAFNATQGAFPLDRLMHELFEEQVARTPQAVAVTHGAAMLTYAQLNSCANQLGRHLRTRGIGPDRLVAICLPRGIEMLVGVLAVLKAGGAYVPLDPTNPPERLQHVLADSGARILLTQDGAGVDLRQAGVESIRMDHDWPTVQSESEENLDAAAVGLTAKHLAYVIYTSGSTGTPKGVMIEHRSLVNYAWYALRRFEVQDGDGSLVCTSLSYDLALTGLYPPLLCGRSVRFCTEQQGLPLIVPELLRSTNLAPLKLTPSHVSLLEDSLKSGQLAGSVRVLVLGGEPLRADVVRLWKAHAPRTRIFNHYGPTETTVGCVVHEVGVEAADAIPIGRPISNMWIYILDRHMQPVPIGVVGEVYIGGVGVARGYLKRPDLTAERFLDDPLRPALQERLYRSGDLGRWRSDGTIEYLGRNDQQVKIRGYRVEPAEISAQLRRHPRVKDAAVVARTDDKGQTRLVAYLTPRSDGRASADELREQVSAVLPEYMVPSAFVTLESLPLTANGKLNTRLLPAPVLQQHTAGGYQAPEGEMEEALARIWRELLALARVGRNDNFFSLGGHSLLALRAVARISSEIEIDLPLRALFDFPTIAQLGDHVLERVAAEMAEF